jgi:predicted adenylyl cyclase CyaB
MQRGRRRARETRVVPQPRRNIELKAVDADPATSLGRCLALGAQDRGTISQRDTYFAVPSGRLKLREQQPGAAQLVQYERPDEARARASHYRIIEVADPDAVRAALAAALGIDVVVEKCRRLLLWEDVRIHLDVVDGLGTFVELEAVARDDSDLTREHELVRELCERLSIHDGDLCAEGYAAQLARDRGAAGA